MLIPVNSTSSFKITLSDEKEEESSSELDVRIRILLEKLRGRRKRRSTTTATQDAMLEHLAYIVLHESRPVCASDFLHFKVGDLEYSLTKGTSSKYLQYLKSIGSIIFCYRTTNSYYSLENYRFAFYPTWVNPVNENANLRGRGDLADLIERLAYDTPAAHDIRLWFNAPDIYERMAVRTITATTSGGDNDSGGNNGTNNSNNRTVVQLLGKRQVSKDLVIPTMILDAGIKAKITVSKNDSVSIILACTNYPVKFDTVGLLNLHSSLSKIEERLRKLVFDLAHIPHFSTWTVTMWHINHDSIETYAGEKFQVAWRDFTGAWISAYSKTSKGVVRLERQEYPGRSVKEAVEEKLTNLQQRGTGTTGGGEAEVVGGAGQ